MNHLDEVLAYDLGKELIDYDGEPYVRVTLWGVGGETRSVLDIVKCDTEQIADDLIRQWYKVEPPDLNKERRIALDEITYS